MKFLKYFRRAPIPVLIFSLVCGCFFNMETNSAASTGLHAYTLQRASVLDNRMKKVGVLEKGIVFSYKKQKGNFVQISYYGKKRYVRADSLVLDKDMAQYIRVNYKKFDSKVRLKSDEKVRPQAAPKGCIYRASGGSWFKVYGKYGSYYKVQVDGKFGYVPCSAVTKACFVDVVSFPKIAGTTKREKIVNFARKFLGNPYVWGGTSLTSGCDCSGFIQQIYKQFGYSLPRCSYEQAVTGRKVRFSEMKPGDLVFYYRGKNIGHVTMYIGNGKCIQARGARYGIVVTDYDYSQPAWARRII